MKLTVEFKGKLELMRKLEKLGDRAEQVVAEAAQAGAEVVAREANRLAPAPKIEVEVKKTSRYQAEVKIGFPKDKWYWRFLETGAQPHEIKAKEVPLIVYRGRDERLIRTPIVSHPGMAARPFLRPAIDKEKDRATDKAGSVFRRILNEQVE